MVGRGRRAGGTTGRSMQGLKVGVCHRRIGLAFHPSFHDTVRLTIWERKHHALSRDQILVNALASLDMIAASIED